MVGGGDNWGLMIGSISDLFKILIDPNLYHEKSPTNNTYI